MTQQEIRELDRCSMQDFDSGDFDISEQSDLYLQTTCNQPHFAE